MSTSVGVSIILPLVLVSVCLLYSSEAAPMFSNATEALKNTPELSKLYAAAKLIRLDTDGTFNGKGNWEATIFAPTNAAFDKMLKRKGINFEEWMSDPDDVRDTLLHHIVSGYQIKEPASWLYNLQVISSMLTRVNGRSKLTVVKKAGTPLAIHGGINLAPFTKKRSISAGDRVTLIELDEVLLPDRTAPAVKPLPDTKFVSLAEAIQKIPGLETFWNILKKNKALVAYLSDPNLNATVFAPNDKAMQDVVSTLNTTPEAFLTNYTYLNKVLLNHIVPDVTTNTLDFKDRQRLPTLLSGHTLGIQLYNLHIVPAGDLSKGKIVYNLPRSLSIISVHRGTLDVVAGKGALHVIDGYCLPA